MLSLQTIHRCFAILNWEVANWRGLGVLLVLLIQILSFSHSRLLVIRWWTIWWRTSRLVSFWSISVGRRRDWSHSFCFHFERYCSQRKHKVHVRLQKGINGNSHELKRCFSCVLVHQYKVAFKCNFSFHLIFRYISYGLQEVKSTLNGWQTSFERSRKKIKMI